MATVNPSYADDGSLREQDQVPLRNFLAFKDRAQLKGRGQPFFSGREKEINAFRSVASALSLGIGGNATLVVEGPPGSGKSALLAQFQEEMRGLPPTEVGGRRWLPVLLDGALAMSPREIMASVDEAIAERLARDLLSAQGNERASAISKRLASLIGSDALDNALSVARGILDRGVTAMGFSIGSKGAAPAGSMPQVARHRARDWADWQIVLLIDEAQGISANAPSGELGTLSAIHQGLPSASMSFCAFGLPGTLAALRAVNVSGRSSWQTLRLSCLEDWESEMAVNRCFAQYRVANGDAWKRAILDHSSNWPQHLAAYLNAALTVLKANAPSPETMGDAERSSLAEAVSLGDEERIECYRDRVDSLTERSFRFEEFARVLVPVFRNDGGKPLKADVTGFLSTSLSLDDGEIHGFLKAAERSGFISSVAEGRRYAMPIPSFAGHLLDKPMSALPASKTAC